MAEALLTVLLLALALYAVLGGADFGAGIIEGLIGRRARKRVDVAIAPVWEANHVWLILAIVIAFVGFPRLYTIMATYLHVPLSLALLGIVARGSAFTFRHYDPSPTFKAGYTLAFRLASALTPVALGLITAAVAAGTLPSEPTGDFYAVFIAPWNTTFGWATGAFTCALFAFEGAALLAAEQPPDGAIELPYLRAARATQWLAIGMGGVVLLIAYLQDMRWLHDMMSSPPALVALLLASVLVAVIAVGFHAGRPWLVRVTMGAQVFCVLGGFAFAQLPILLRTRTADLTYRELAAPDATLRGLLWAIGIGLLLIGPAFSYLIVVYKLQGREPSVDDARKGPSSGA